MSNNKFIALKVFITASFISGGVSLFSQINHEDSLHYLEVLKLNSLEYRRIKGTAIPVFIIKDKNGDSLTDNNLKSKTTFINFWFETCAPCIAEFQALEKFYNNNKFRENFQFISITFEPDSVKEQVRKKHNLTYPMYHLPRDGCRKILGRLGYPSTFIVNKNLEIVFVTSGGPTDPKIADKHLNYFIQAELEKYLKF